VASGGTITVDFAAETARFTSELKKVRGDLKGLKDDTSSLASGMRTAGAALVGLFSAAAIGAGIRAIVKATEESEQAISNLNNALKTAGANVAVASEDMQAFASEMQRMTTFSDEAVVGVESLLLGFRGLSSGTIKQATADILDLSTRLGIDLDSAAKTVGRALEDPVAGLTALRRAGVQFTDDQKRLVSALVETGEKAEAQQVILKELEARFKGAAEAARDTLGGAIKGVKNAFDDLLEAKGGLPGATKSLNDFAKVLSSPEIKEGFEAIIAGLVKIVETAAKAAGELAKFGAAAGKALGKAITGGVEVNVVKALQAELDHELEVLKALQQQQTINAFTFGKDISEQISKERDYIETLKLRIEIAKQAQPRRDFLTALTPAADSIIAGITQPTEFTTPEVPAGESDEALKRRIEQTRQLNDFLKEERKNANDIIKADIADQLQFEDEQYREFGLRRLEVQQLAYEADIEAARQASLSKREIAQQERDFHLLMDQEVIASRQRAVQAGIGLLQLLAQKSKTAAIALILVNRGLMIAQAIQNTSAAVTKALAIYGPTPAGFAAAAAAKTLGAIEIGLIAATGALEIGQVTSGNSGSVVGPGTPNNPIFTDNGQEERTFGASSKSAVEITINGFVGPEILQEMLDHITEAVGERDVVIINQGSRQAQELIGG
jgi:hypothetical protein